MIVIVIVIATHAPWLCVFDVRHRRLFFAYHLYQYQCLNVYAHCCTGTLVKKIFQCYSSLRIEVDESKEFLNSMILTFASNKMIRGKGFRRQFQIKLDHNVVDEYINDVNAILINIRWKIMTNTIKHPKTIRTCT